MTSRSPRAPLPRLAYRTHGRRRRPGDVHTIESFCLSNAISQSKYFALKREGRGPREIDLGDRIIITAEAEADWRKEREAETAAERERMAKSA
jgi:hypothetical protein